MPWYWPDREIVVSHSGESLWEECPCGKMRRKDTLEHVELVTRNLEDLMKELKPRPCVSAQGAQDEKA